MRTKFCSIGSSAVAASNAQLQRVVSFATAIGRGKSPTGSPRHRSADGPRLAKGIRTAPANATITVASRFGAQQPKRLSDRSTFGLQIVCAPEHHCHCLRQRRRGPPGAAPAIDRPAGRHRAPQMHSGSGMDRIRAGFGRSAKHQWCAADRHLAPGAYNRRPVRG